MSSKIEIALSKTKVIGLLLGTIIFILLGILFINSSETFVYSFMRNREMVRIVGIISVAFFGLCLFVIARKLFDSKPGLIIDQHGITNNTNAINRGLIEWEDITGIKVEQIRSTKFLILYTKFPEEYINKARNRFVREAMKMNHRLYGSPISITSNALKINFNDLEKLIRSEFEKRKLPAGRSL